MSFMQMVRLSPSSPVHRRGYSLPFVLLILILLSVSLASLLFVLTAGARSTESMLGRRRLFYACDGLSRIAAVSAQNYFAQTGDPTSEALRDFVCAEGGGCTEPGAPPGDAMLPTFMSQTPGHVVTTFDLSQVASRRIAPLDSGPFEGMVAMQDNVDMKVEIKKTSSGWKCDVTQELALAKISMFQFFIFSDQPYTDWAPGPDMAGDGRVHANGDLCFFSLGSGLWIDRVTASGKVSPGIGNERGVACRSKSNADNQRSYAAPLIATRNAPVFDTNPAPPNPDPIEPNNSHFRVFDKRSEVLSEWLAKSDEFNGHLQDVAHRVVNLRLPVLGNPPVQQGADASLGPVDNTTTRLLVDPVVPGESRAISGQRFAFKADIRIINGVWYKRLQANPEDIGEPIWSDHPGKLTTVNEAGVFTGGDAVGQDDLFDGVDVSLLPTRFSYYRFDETNKLLTSSLSPAAVVSYGLLARDPSTTTPKTPLWKPGVYCGAGVAAAGTSSCPGNLGSHLLDGMRSGFRDVHAHARFTNANDRALANVLPMNIDVAALQNALGDCDARELGSHFPGTCNNTDDRRFNGIVYISNTWPGALATTPLTPPGQGARGAGSTSTIVQMQPALPEPVCASTGGAAITTATGPGGVSFAACSTYQGALPTTMPTKVTSVVGTRPTVVRLYNLRALNKNHTSGRPFLDKEDLLDNGVGALGLTIASNLPVYTVGDVNLSSVPGSTPWVPLLVAGDVVSILSNDWDDSNARWTSDLVTASRRAGRTTVNMEMLAGWTPTTSSAYSGGLHNFPRFLEDWDTIPLRIRGSLVVGWAAVYARWKRECCGPVSYDAPNRDWGYDTNLENILNQPPGAPLFDVQATRRWTR